MKGPAFGVKSFTELVGRYSTASIILKYLIVSYPSSKICVPATLLRRVEDRLWFESP